MLHQRSALTLSSRWDFIIAIHAVPEIASIYVSRDHIFAGVGESSRHPRPHKGILSSDVGETTEKMLQRGTGTDESIPCCFMLP